MLGSRLFATDRTNLGDSDGGTSWTMLIRFNRLITGVGLLEMHLPQLSGTGLILDPGSEQVLALSIISSRCTPGPRRRLRRPISHEVRQW